MMPLSCANDEGLTFYEWIAASGCEDSRRVRKAWRAGEDPTDWRAALPPRPPAVSPMRGTGSYDRGFLARLDRAGLRRALWLLRRQDARPDEVNPAAAQYDGHATAGSVRAEYRRRGWRVPHPSRAERP
jgi:hypothetical protein